MPVHIGSAVLVTGDTYEKKAKLIAIGQGHWCKQLNGWIFPESSRAQVVAAMGDDISEEQVLHTPTPSVDANATLLVSRHKKATLVTGETIKVKTRRLLKPRAPASLVLTRTLKPEPEPEPDQVKTQLSLLKGSWNKALVGWIFPAGSKDAVLELLRQDPTDQVRLAAARAATPPQAPSLSRARMLAGRGRL